MILIDTHIWIWWVQGDPRLSLDHSRRLDDPNGEETAVSIISCWGVAKLAELKRLQLPETIGDWLDYALRYPRVRLLDLTPEIAVESTQLPQHIHRDPADQIIIATARIHLCRLITADHQILSYPHVLLL